MPAQPAAALPPAPPSTAGDPVDEIFTGIDPQTGAELPPRDVAGELRTMRDDPVSWQRDDIYQGIAELVLTDEQITILTATVTDDEIEIKPDSFGAVYLAHASYRKRLNRVFKPGGWAQRQIGEWRYDPDTHILSAEFALYARDSNGKVCYVSKAIGAQKYHGGQGDSDMSYDDAAQGAESNSLTRNCKQLGIALELWEKRTATQIRNRLGVCVKYTKKYKDRHGNWKDGDVRLAWRRWDEDPIKGEIGISSDSPNHDRYRGPQARAQAQTQQQTRPQAHPAASQAAASSAAQPSASQQRPADYMPAKWGEPGYISEAQAKRLFAIRNDSGISEEAVSKYLRERYHISSSKQIKRSDYNAIVDWVKKGGD